MLVIGSDDGVYRRADPLDSDAASTTQILECGRVVRVRTFDSLPGLFAATMDGLYHTSDGTDWTDLGVPTDRVYSVGAHPSGEALYVGTRPARVYATREVSAPALQSELSWTNLEGVQQLPSRAAWRLPRHDDLAHVRDVHVHPDAPNRVVAGVEVGGVHASDDGGATWTERRDGVNDDVHELHLVDGDRWVAATGFGLFVTADAGESWTRLDEGVEQRYFRTAYAHEGRLFAGAALANSSTWNDPDADPQLFVSRDFETLEPVDLPESGTVTGITAVEGDVVVGTHRGTLYREPSSGSLADAWRPLGEFPVPEAVTGRYTPLEPFDPA